MTAHRRHRGLLALTTATILAACSILSFSACTEHSALPTAPTSPTAAGTWQRLWPEFGCSSLHAVWGLDADDMWAVGDYGAILHWDGRQVIRHECPTLRTLYDVAGNARDDVWAVGHGVILHWDGRRWDDISLDADFEANTVWCESPATVYVGGELDNDPCVYRHDGGGWQAVPFMTQPQDRITHVWRPGPDYPLLAASPERLHRLVEGEFRWVEPEVDVHNVDGDLILIGDDPRQLIRVNPDGTLDMVCNGGAGHDLGEADQLLASHQPLISVGPNLQGIHNCLTRQVYDGNWWPVTDLATPTIAGADAGTIFAVGHGSLFVRLVWQDWNLIPTDLVREMGPFPKIDLAATGSDLFAIGSYQNLIRFDGTEWLRLDEPIDVHYLRALDDGRIAIWSDTEIAVGDGLGGPWQVLPTCPIDLRESLWIDSTIRPRMMSRAGHLWAFESGAWVELPTWPGGGEPDVFVTDFTGRAVDDLWACGYHADTGPFLKHFDGTAWSDVVFGTTNPTFETIHAGAHTGDLYVEGWAQEHDTFEGVVRDGDLIVFAAFTATQHDLVELSPDVALSLRGRIVYQLVDDTWQPIEGPFVSRITALTGHPDQGIFTLATERHVHRRDVPEAP